MSFRRPALVVAVVLAAASLASGRGCGEPAFDEDPHNQTHECSTNQCSRFLDGYCVRGWDAGEACEIDKECYTGKCTDHVCDDDNCGNDGSDISAGCAANNGKNQVLGYITAAVAIFCFGSNFVPVKTYETGNGIYFQWILCSGIMFTGVAMQMIRGSPPLHPYALLGGVLWASGNVLCVPIIKMVGLSLGLSLWGVTNLILGWSSGKFGLIGVKKEAIDHEALNIIGVCVAVIAVMGFSTIEPTLDGDAAESDSDEEGSADINTGEKDPLTSKRRRTNSIVHGGIGGIASTATVSEVGGQTFEEKLGPWRRPLGVFLSCIAGGLFGISFDPATHMENFSDSLSTKGLYPYSTNGLDYVFGHFIGIYCTSTFFMLTYSALRMWRPDLVSDDNVDYKSLLLPAFLSGIMWAIADLCWFAANSNLGLVVAFPLITTGPGLVSCLWGVAVFGEITGRVNLIKLAVSFITLGIAVTLITISKS
ncbi:Transmembrane protein 144-like protein B [Diplonema papillatum]|nr:Transmembrane protein 144-like protein B [Diplonema papillatum]|eukprot:gene18191-28026_t